MIARTLALLALLALSSCGGGDQTGGELPPPELNVVLVVLDTTRADHLGCYGHPESATPNIDRLAAEGIRYVCDWINDDLGALDEVAGSQNGDQRLFFLGAKM